MYVNIDVCFRCTIKCTPCFILCFIPSLYTCLYNLLYSWNTTTLSINYTSIFQNDLKNNKEFKKYKNKQHITTSTTSWDSESSGLLDDWRKQGDIRAESRIRASEVLNDFKLGHGSQSSVSSSMKWVTLAYQMARAFPSWFHSGWNWSTKRRGRTKLVQGPVKKDCLN